MSHLGKDLVPSAENIIGKLKERYSSCSSYSDKGEFTRKVDRAGYNESFPFRTHFVKPGQFYLKFREQANTIIIRSKNTGVILLASEYRDDKKVFVPFKKFSSLETALAETFHHEFFPVFSLILLSASSLTENQDILSCEYSLLDNTKDDSSYLLKANSDLYGQIELSVDKENSCLKKASVHRAVKSVECKFKKIKFDQPIPDSVYKRIKLHT